MEANATTKFVKFGSVSFSLEGIRRIASDLNVIVREQGEIEIAALKKKPEDSDEEFEAIKADARRDVFKILMTVAYEDGSLINTYNTSDISIDQNGPFIRSIYFSNVPPYKIYTGNNPAHSFDLFLDFRQPPLLDAGHIVSTPTPNETNLTVSGARGGWRVGIEDVVRKHIKKKRPIRRFFHGPFIYDFGFLLVGLPLIFYACLGASPHINSYLGATNPFVVAAAYAYIAMATAWGYRVMFSYSKWAFPLVELSDQATRPAKHRKIWWALVILVAGKIFWPIVDPLFDIKLWWLT